MKRILIMSDIHGKWKEALKIIKNEKYDISISLGDSEIDENTISKYFDYYVGGNNDYGYSIEEQVIQIEGITIAICHGHTRGIYVQDSFQEAIEFAKEKNATMILHGHSHKIRHEKSQGIDVICPGSINYPRTNFGASYMILTLDKTKIINLEWKKVK